MSVDVVLNPNARKLRDGSALREALLAAARGRARVHETRTLEELEQVARDIAARGTRAVVLAGGDGSHMAGVSALARAFGEELPTVALAPGGTVCTVARNWAAPRANGGRPRGAWGLPGGARAWAERVVRAAGGDAVAPVRRKPTLRVRDADGGNRVGFIFGTGLVARFFDVYYADARPGLGSAARIAARAFAGSFVDSPFARRVLGPTACSIAVDGERHAARAWSLVLASVVPDVGLHVLATYRAGEALDRFHVVASGLPARALGWQVPRVVSGRAMRGEPHVDALARELLVSFDEAAASYVLDGDVIRAREVRVEPGPVLPLLVP